MLLKNPNPDPDLYLQRQVHEQIKIQQLFCVAFGRDNVSKQPWIHDPCSELTITLYHIWHLTYKYWPESFWCCWKTVQNDYSRGWCTPPALHQHWWGGGRYTSVYLPTFSSTLYFSSSSSSVAAVMLKTNMHCAKPKFFFRIQSN